MRRRHSRLARRISSSLGCSSGRLFGRQRLRVEFDLRGCAYQNLLEARDRFGLRKHAVHDSAEQCEFSRCGEPWMTDSYEELTRSLSSARVLRLPRLAAPAHMDDHYEEAIYGIYQ